MLATLSIDVCRGRDKDKRSAILNTSNCFDGTLGYTYIYTTVYSIYLSAAMGLF